MMRLFAVEKAIDGRSGGMSDDASYIWDPKKNEANKDKHGISFEEAAAVFEDEFHLAKFDEAHSWEEDRWITLGRLPDGRIVVVVHTFRSDQIRIISARLATRSERMAYEEERRH
jgi:uncharacterized DUF497 family protein